MISIRVLWQCSREEAQVDGRKWESEQWRLSPPAMCVCVCVLDVMKAEITAV